MASYSSFKKIDSNALVDGLAVKDLDIATGSLESDDVSAITEGKLANNSIVAGDKLASNIDLSAKTVTYRSIVNADVASGANIAADKLGSGAAAANLGYTPVLNTGTQNMTGSLQVTNGSAGAPSVKAGDANTGYYMPTSGELRFSTNGSDSMVIETGGPVRYPQKPAFAAVGQPGWLYSNSYGGTGTRELNSIMNWNLAHQYGGSNFNTSNGRFTAPVSGWYHFSTMWYLLNQTNGTNSYVHLFFQRNGSVNILPSSRVPYTINMHGNFNNYDDGANYNMIMYLNSGQYCSLAVRWHANGNSRHHAGHQIFSGQLIG